MTATLLAFTAAAAIVGLGGGLYEFSVVDPFWPKRPDIVQPARGGISRRRFWMPAHTVFELLLIVSLFTFWSQSDIRFWLLVALASHAVMRIWSAFDFIPKALAFETAAASSITEGEARKWTRRSMLRFPLDIITCVGTMMALLTAMHGA